MSEATPGPWVADKDLTPSDPGASALQCRFFYGPNGLAIFRMGLGYENAATDAANAALISAAPDLLEVAKELKELFRFALLSTSPAIAKDGMEFIRKAEAAIAKASQVKP